MRKFKNDFIYLGVGGIAILLANVVTVWTMSQRVFLLFLGLLVSAIGLASFIYHLCGGK